MLLLVIGIYSYICLLFMHCLILSVLDVWLIPCSMASPWDLTHHPIIGYFDCDQTPAAMSIQLWQLEKHGALTHSLVFRVVEDRCFSSKVHASKIIYIFSCTCVNVCVCVRVCLHGCLPEVATLFGRHRLRHHLSCFGKMNGKSYIWWLPSLKKYQQIW